MRLAPITLLALIALGSSAASTADHRATQAESGTIVFVGSRGDFKDGTDRHALYLINGNGGGQRRLTSETAARIDEPRWSPNGRLIVFERSGQVHVIGKDGDRLRQLTTGNASSGTGAWSPNGRRLAYSRGPLGRSDIHVMNADGTGKRRLTRLNREHIDGSAAWSPDGRTIAFTRYAADQSPVYLVNADGSGLRRLTSIGNHLDGSPTWSPDGSVIAFSRFFVTPGKHDIFLVNVSSGAERNLTRTKAISEANPAWSPRGETISFQVSTGTRGIRIEVMNADGGGRRIVARNSGDEATTPSWSTSGRRLVYVGHVGNRLSGEREIYVVSISNASLRRVTRNKLGEAWPQWSPP
jgi:TolB protein